MNRLTAVGTFLIVLAIGLQSSVAAEPARAKKALYIGIDGTRFDALTTAETPHLDSLIEQGIAADNCLILGERYRKNDTVSGPGWSTILTGVWADKHGVQDNSFKGRNYDRYPHLFTLLKRQRPAAHTASFVTWMPIEDYIVRDADTHAGFHDDQRDYAKYDLQAAEAAAKYLSEPKLDCIFVYFGQVDESGHAHGFHPSVPQYVKAIETVDGHVGQLLAALKARPTYAHEDWVIVVTSDHGGKGTGHGGGHRTPEILNSFLIVSGDSARRGRFTEQTYLVDAAATVLAHLGVQPAEQWELDGEPRGLK
ncbi:MAG: alkaline phosphatase family protein [Planctomycetales bacterium]|nr:alkaline phosphatase family protein [Planctomycetales bacterium]